MYELLVSICSVVGIQQRAHFKLQSMNSASEIYVSTEEKGGNTEKLNFCYHFDFISVPPALPEFYILHFLFLGF